MHLLALLSRQEGVPVGPCLVFWLHEVALLHFRELLPALVLWLCLGSSSCFAEHALFLVVLVYLPLVHEESYLRTSILHQGDNTPQILDQFVGIELFTISSARHLIHVPPGQKVSSVLCHHGSQLQVVAEDLFSELLFRNEDGIWISARLTILFVAEIMIR